MKKTWDSEIFFKNGAADMSTDPLDLWRQFIAVDDELRTIRMFDSPAYLIERRDAIVAQARCVVEAE